jgi:putative nucleotidyltransferase with HDIG domain
MEISSNIQQRIKRIENLATLPTVATEILESIRSENSSMREISQIIEKDASVTTKILKVSNSPLWGVPGRIANVQKALVVLGLKQITNIVIAISLYSTFTKLKPNPYFDREKFWLHSAGTGQVARTLSQKLNLSFHGEEFVAALIHDIGKLVLDQFFSEEFRQILIRARQDQQPILKIENQNLGCTHADIGAWLLEQWNFPETITAAVAFHHEPEKAVNHKLLSSIIYLADTMCEMWGAGFDQDTVETYLPENPAWLALNEVEDNSSNLDWDTFVEELKAEIDMAELFIQIIRD